jgi:hypothetical protein
VADIDVLEVYNARLLRESFNDEALRFARKYRLLQGAGSDAHVLQGVGTGALRMRRFEGPEEFLLSLRTAEVLRRPKSLAYLQSLKWVAQAKEKLGAPQYRSRHPAPHASGAEHALLELDGPLDRLPEQGEQLLDRLSRLPPPGLLLRDVACLQRVGDGLHDVVDVERLGDVRDGARLDRSVDERARAAGERDDGHVPLRQDAPGHLHAVEPWQAEVEQDHVGLVLARERDGLDAVRGVGADAEAGILEHEPQLGSGVRVVLHGEDGRDGER